MKSIYFIRHAKSSWDDPSLRDFDRPLNGRGKKDAPLMGLELAKRSIKPNLIISSPAKRAKITAQVIAKSLAYDTQRILYDEQLYHASMQDYLDILEDVDDVVDRLFIVSHNPGTNCICDRLNGAYLGNIPTTGIVAFDADISRWRDLQPETAHKTLFIYPKMFK
jgi:phosphohistidine phosphatase